MTEEPPLKYFYQGEREDHLFRKEPPGGKGAGHGRHRVGFQWRDAWCRPYERKGGGG